VAIVPGLPKRKGNIAVFDHMLYLSPHRKAEQNDPIDHQNWPEDRDVEEAEPGAHKANGDSPGGGVPKLEFWKASDERPELLILLRWQVCAILQSLVLGERGVEFRLQEGKEEVEQVDAQRVAYYIPALCEDDPQQEYQQQHPGADPSI